MELTYRYRLYPTEKQLKRILNTCSGARFLFNQLLTMRTETFRKTRLWCALDAETVIEQNGFLTEMDQSALSWSVRRLEQAYKKFFSRKPKVKERYRPECQYKLQNDPHYQLDETDLSEYPRYKRKKQIVHQSYTTSAPEVRIDGNRVLLPYVGYVKIKMHRPLPADMEQILHYTVIVKRSGHVFLLVRVTLPDVPKREDLCRPLGIVFNPSRLAVRSDAVPVAFSHTDPKLAKKIERAKKELKRSQRGSKASEEKKRKLAALYEKQTNQRWDSLHKAARQIANAEYVDTVCMETPAVKQRKAQWAQTPGMEYIIWDEAWWLFSKMVQYKLERQGKHFWRVEQDFPAHSICCNCSEKVAPVPMQSQWICPHCGVSVDNAVNAALNLRALAEQYIQSRN